MHLVPVIDLRGGLVVHARRGQRHRYAPLRSPLCPGADPGSVLGSLLELYPFDCCYVADLDAIAGTGDNLEVLRGLQHRWPDLEWWVDAGPAWGSLPSGIVPVLGSESLPDPAPLEAGRSRLILSLDFRGDAFLGPQALLRPSLWPETVLAMNLHRVGSGSGPDFTLLQRLRRLHEGKVYAAGGVRHRQDLERLAAAGVDGALVASALHAGTLSPEDLATL